MLNEVQSQWFTYAIHARLALLRAVVGQRQFDIYLLTEETARKLFDPYLAHIDVDQEIAAAKRVAVVGRDAFRYLLRVGLYPHDQNARPAADGDRLGAFIERLRGVLADYATPAPPPVVTDADIAAVLALPANDPRFAHALHQAKTGSFGATVRGIDDDRTADGSAT